MNSTGVPGLLQMLINISGSFPVILKLIVAVSALMGTVMVVRALTGLNRYHQAASGSHTSGTILSGSQAASKIIIGTLLTMPVVVMSMSGNTLIAGAAVSGGAFQYPSGASEMQKAAMAAVCGLFVIVGYLAFIKGFRILDAHYSNNDQHAKPGAAIWHIVGGVACVYLQQFASLLSDWTGFNLANYLF